mmetsp:Transcript_29985/g.41436  ORF Transcript_29985/g.41436 Transcript_29985/m.41436 type:complete len:417 (+) Transcript_29985:149-1399(+)
MAAEEEDGRHLVVLTHGLGGCSADMNAIGDCLLKKFGPSHIVLLPAQSYEGRTTEGVDLCGQLATTEIMKHCDKYPDIRRISFVGHSMGGLIARFAVGLLREGNFFKRVEPINLITLATPHLGTRRRPNRWWNPIINYSTASWPLGRTGRQLVLDDSGSLLHLMAEPHQMFYQALGRFKKRILYSNVYDDIIVSYSTAAISAFNPYRIKNQLDSSTNPVILRRTAEGVLDETRLALGKLSSSEPAPPVPSGMVKNPKPPPPPSLNSGGDGSGGGGGGSGGGSETLKIPQSTKKSVSAPNLQKMETEALKVIPHNQTDDALELSQGLASRVLNSQHSFWSVAPSDASSVHSNFLAEDEHDEQAEKMRFVYDALQSLEWERFDVIFNNNPFAHEDIISKNMSHNLVVPKHLASIFLIK